MIFLNPTEGPIWFVRLTATAVALAGERTRVVLSSEAKYDISLAVAEALGFGPKAISLRKSIPGIDSPS